MFRPAPFFIGLRYTRAKHRNQFISLISFISIFGIALGVAVLITVLSVVNGFDREIRKQIFDMIAPITISSHTGEIEHWQELASTIQSMPLIKGVAPFVSGEAMLTHSDFTLPTMLIGILPEQESGVSALAKKMVQGQLDHLIAGQSGIIIGKELAEKFNLSPGDQITVATLKASSSLTHMTPQFKKFTVTGIFRAGGGGLGFDSKMAFIHLQDARQLMSVKSGITGLHINIQDVYAAPAFSRALANQLPPSLLVWNWTNQLGDFFENIRMTKTIMFLIFVLIITVAVFNLVSTMVMVVKNKEADIAILRTLGATPQMILIIFIVQGLILALAGTLLGIVGGITLSWNVTGISTFIQDILHKELISSHIYFVNYLPSDLQWHDVWMISLTALFLSLLSALYPAFKASRMIPVEALNG